MYKYLLGRETAHLCAGGGCEGRTPASLSTFCTGSTVQERSTTRQEGEGWTEEGEGWTGEGEGWTLYLYPLTPIKNAKRQNKQPALKENIQHFKTGYISSVFFRWSVLTTWIWFKPNKVNADPDPQHWENPLEFTMSMFRRLSDDAFLVSDGFLLVFSCSKLMHECLM